MSTSPANLNENSAKVKQENNKNNEVQEGVNIKSQTFDITNASKGSLKQEDRAL